MDLDDRAIERHRLHFNLHDLLALQFLKDSLNHSAFAPPVHPCVDGVPLSQSLGQAVFDLFDSTMKKYQLLPSVSANKVTVIERITSPLQRLSVLEKLNRDQPGLAPLYIGGDLENQPDCFNP